MTTKKKPVPPLPRPAKPKKTAEKPAQKKEKLSKAAVRSLKESLPAMKRRLTRRRRANPQPSSSPAMLRPEARLPEPVAPPAPPSSDISPLVIAAGGAVALLAAYLTRPKSAGPASAIPLCFHVKGAEMQVLFRGAADKLLAQPLDRSRRASLRRQEDWLADQAAMLHWRADHLDPNQVYHVTSAELSDLRL